MICPAWGLAKVDPRDGAISAVNHLTENDGAADDEKWISGVRNFQEDVTKSLAVYGLA